MPYTAQQQTKIDAAKASLDAAQRIMDNAKADAESKYSALSRCVKGKGDPGAGACKGGQPLSASKMPAFLTAANPQDCRVCGPLLGCKTDCCKEDTCKNRVNDYNASLTTYSSAKTAYATAKSNYDTVLNQITIELQNDPELQGQIAASTAEAQAEGKIRIIKWTVFGIIVVIVVGTFVYFKWIKK